MTWHVWPCPICKTSNYVIAPFTARRDAGGCCAVAICKTCGLTPYVGDRPADFERVMRHEYYENNLCSFDWTHKKKLSIVMSCLDELERIRPLKGARLLDVGCGQGVLMELTRRRGAIVQGVEPSISESLKRREQGFACFTGFLHEFEPKDDEMFDIVTLSWTLDSMLDPIEELRGCRRLVAPDGLLVLIMWTMFHVPFFKPVPGNVPYPALGPKAIGRHRLARRGIVSQMDAG